MPAPMTLADRIRTRLAPAVLTAAGVTLLAAGLLSYLDPVPASGSAGVSPSPVVTATPAPSPSVRPSPPPASPSASPAPSASVERATATRVVIPALRIDLPVMEGPDTYPPCDVAMYIRQLGQPGEPAATYLYAHARTGMFLPLLTESERRNGARMLGMLVQVYTSDDRLHLYEITEVLRHQTTLDRPLAAREEQLWLQTSEGPKGTIPKLQVVAMPLSSGPADPAEAHPTPEPVACG
jgi:hypothetical protein